MPELKTDYADYNAIDFVQNNEEMQELTVEITLCEYRHLLGKAVDFDRVIGENAKLQEENEGLKQFILTKFPELTDDIISVVRKFLSSLKENDSEATTT